MRNLNENRSKSLMSVTKIGFDQGKYLEGVSLTNVNLVLNLLRQKKINIAFGRYLKKLARVVPYKHYKPIPLMYRAIKLPCM